MKWTNLEGIGNSFGSKKLRIFVVILGILLFSFLGWFGYVASEWRLSDRAVRSAKPVWQKIDTRNHTPRKLFNGHCD